MNLQTARSKSHERTSVSGCAVLMSFLACTGVFSEDAANNKAVHGEETFFAENGYRDAVELIYHPSGHHHNGTTYLAYEGTKRAPFIVAYQHNTKQWTGPIKAGDNPLFVDDDGHGRPSIVVDDTGFIHVVFGGHGGPKYGKPKNDPGVNPFGTSGRGEQTHVVSVRPGDITEWKKVENISQHGTYSQFVKADNGDLFLFYRHGTHKSDWVYQRSSDHGNTFQPPVIVLKHKTDSLDPRLHDSWYAHAFKGTNNSVHIAFVLHPCHEVNHSLLRRNVYYLKMELNEPVAWINAAGLKFPLPADRDIADRQALVFDSNFTDVRSAIAKGDDHDRPHLIFRSTLPGQQSKVMHTRWTGDAWQELSAPAHDRHSRSTDLHVSSAKDAMVVSNVGPVIPFTSTDGGVTWSEQSAVTSRHDQEWHISAQITGFHQDARWVLVERRGGDDNSRLHLWGDNGFVRRTH